MPVVGHDGERFVILGDQEIADSECCTFPCATLNDLENAEEFSLTTPEGIAYLRRRHEIAMICSYSETGKCALQLAEMHPGLESLPLSERLGV